VCTLMSVSNQGSILYSFIYIYICMYMCIYIYITVEMSALALAHPLSCSMGTGVQGHFVVAKWPEYENDLLFPSNAKFKNKWSYTPLPLYAL